MKGTSNEPKVSVGRVIVSHFDGWTGGDRVCALLAGSLFEILIPNQKSFK
jgi:hypothetical protein